MYGNGLKRRKEPEVELTGVVTTTAMALSIQLQTATTSASIRTVATTTGGSRPTLIIK